MVVDIPIRYIQRGREGHIGGAYKALVDADIEILPASRYGFLGLEGVKLEGQLTFPVGRYRAWLWQPVYELAQAQGYIRKVRNVFLYDAEPLFAAYIAHIYGLRQQHKAAGDTAGELLDKLLMNSLYGKFGQRDNANWLAVEDAAELSVMSGVGERFRENWQGADWEYWQTGNMLWRQSTEERGLAKQSVCSIAGYITAMGRATLWRGMAQILDSGGRVFMCDTDSIVADCRLPDAMVSSTELGAWKLEAVHRGADCRFYAPKHYVMGGKIVLKGVRQPQSAEGQHPQAVFPRFMTDLTSRNPVRRERLEGGGVMTYIVKEPTGRNTKRIEHAENAPTLPIVLG